MAKQLYCNKCGKKFDMWDEKQYFHIERCIGYGSIYDGERLELDLCCDCMDELVKSCTINPIIKIAEGG